MLALRHSRKEVLHASRRERAFACTVSAQRVNLSLQDDRPYAIVCLARRQAVGPKKGFHTTDECRNATRTLQRTRARVLSAEWCRQMPLCAVAIAKCARTVQSRMHVCVCVCGGSVRVRA